MKMSCAARRFLKFCIVGSSGVFVNAGLLYFFTEIILLNYKLASIIAIECAICNNFVWNFLWTWRDRSTTSVDSIVRSFLKFNFSSGVVAFIVNWILLVALTELFGLHYHISNFIGIAAGTCANFFFSHFWVFSKRHNKRSYV